jgi:polar amino acid transport system substrate-binding protein
MSYAQSQRRVALKALALGLTAPTATFAAEPVLVLATGAREPMVSSPGKPGFVEEVAREAFRRAGYGLRVLALPHERALQNANAGIEDGDLYRAAGFEKDYPNLVQVPQPLLEQDFVAMSRRPDIEVRGWPDLARYSVGYVTGNKILERQLEGVPQPTSVRDNMPCHNSSIPSKSKPPSRISPSGISKRTPSNARSSSTISPARLIS